MSDKDNGQLEEAEIGQQHPNTQPSVQDNQTVEETRRELLAKLGRFAAYTPPTMISLMLADKAAAQSGGGIAPPATPEATAAPTPEATAAPTPEATAAPTPTPTTTRPAAPTPPI
jgi:hypothetical protein